MTPIKARTVAIAKRCAKEHFGLLIPIRAEELKRAFRAAAKRLHSDTSGDKETSEQFLVMKAAYDFLAKLDGMDFVYGERAVDGSRLITTDGTPLYELGLGVGASRHSQDCESCQHNGYIEEKIFESRLCDRCNRDGQIFSTGPCGPCRGLGRFTQGRSGRTVPCRACHGRGERTGYYLCPSCHGTKSLHTEKAQVRYIKCYECKGTGEIELMKPLSPKGRMINVVWR